MKAAVVASALGLASLTASASYTIRPVAAPVHHTWFCTADGYDYGGRLRSISGGLKATKRDAAREAVRACVGFYTSCAVSSCFQEQ